MSSESCWWPVHVKFNFSFILWEVEHKILCYFCKSEEKIEELNMCRWISQDNDVKKNYENQEGV